MACLACDRLVNLPTLEEGQRADCPRCGHSLTARVRGGFDRPLAFAIAAAVFLAMANAFPFLALKQSGLENVMTLPEAVYELSKDGAVLLAVIFAAAIVAIPAAVIVLLAALLFPLRRGRSAPWLVPAGRWLFFLTPWSMAEVFIIGVIVSLVKIAAMATVVLGVSFWSYAAFAICLTAALSSLDRERLWHAIDEAA
jgi:paraquat-inducible protein A